MSRLIKRYGSRKLYDPEESRYVSLEDISAWVRNGEEITVIDNATSEDVTSQTLTQVIAEEGRKKSHFLSSDVLHDLIRAGENAVSNGVKQFQDGMDRFVKKSINRIAPVRNVRDEMQHLRQRLDELEATLEQTASSSAASSNTATKEDAEKANKATAKKTTTRKRTTTTKKATTANATRKRTAGAAKTTAKKTTTATGTTQKRAASTKATAAKKTATKKASATTGTTRKRSTVRKTTAPKSTATKKTANES